MRISVLYAFLLSVLSLTCATFYRDCGSTSNITSLDVTDCPDDKLVCGLKRGSQISIHLNFTSNSDFEKLKTRVFGILLSLPVPFNVKMKNACSTGVPCPVKEGQEIAYFNYINVLTSYPKLSVDVKWELVSDKNETIACVIIPSKLT